MVLKAIGKYKLLVTAALLTMLLQVGAALWQPSYMKKILSVMANMSLSTNGKVDKISDYGVALIGIAIIGLVGAASLYGLGDHVKVSALIERVQDAVQGRLLVFFPGEVDGNVYRLLGARDGWNYHAIPITSDKGGSL